MFKTPILKPFLPVFIWAFVILALSIGPGVQLPEVAISPDKLGHFIAYGLLSWLTVRALHKTGKLTIPVALLSTVLVVVYGILLEFVQWAFFPNRFFEVWDMAANTAGAALGYFAFNFFHK